MPAKILYNGPVSTPDYVPIPSAPLLHRPKLLTIKDCLSRRPNPYNGPVSTPDYVPIPSAPFYATTQSFDEKDCLCFRPTSCGLSPGNQSALPHFPVDKLFHFIVRLPHARGLSSGNQSAPTLFFSGSVFLIFIVRLPHACGLSSGNQSAFFHICQWISCLHF